MSFRESIEPISLHPYLIDHLRDPRSEANNGNHSVICAGLNVGILQLIFTNTAVDDMTDLAMIKELSASNRHQECLQACQKVLQVNPSEIYAYKYAGKSFIALGSFRKAQQMLAKAHQLDGSDPEIVKDIGNIFNSAQNPHEASKYYSYALKIDPFYSPAINNLGLIAKQQGDLQVAKQLLIKARDLNPTFESFHLNWAGSIETSVSLIMLLHPLSRP